MENKYKTFLYVAVAEAMGEEYEIRIITEDEALKEKPLEPETPKKAAAAPQHWQLRNLRVKNIIRCSYMEVLDWVRPI